MSLPGIATERLAANHIRCDVGQDPVAKGQSGQRLGDRVTLADVAAAAGVSRTTVSWVLNDRARRIPDSTRCRVRAVAERLGYRPNRVARQLRAGRRHAVGIVTALSVPNAANFLRSLATEVKRLGHQLEIMDGGLDPEIELEALRTMVEQQVDAIVLLGDRDPAWPGTDELEAVHGAGLPCIAVSVRCPRAQVPFVTSDHVRMAELATEHLVAGNRTRIALVSEPDAATGPTALLGLRLRGYLKALQAAGLPPMARTLADVSRQSGDSDGGLVSCVQTCDAIVASSDITALRVIRTAREQGVALPSNLAVVAIGESPLVELVSPRLSQVVQPHADYVRAISRILRDVLQDSHGWDGRSIVTEPRLIVRESSLNGGN